MPLPLPNLDTRRWADLLEEGRALIPRHAPGWTDHNVHDPGIMLVELFAWLVEQDIYRLNRVTERHRRKFLSLAGFAPAPPHAAHIVLAFEPSAPALTLPAGVALETAGADRSPIRVVTLDEITIGTARIDTVVQMTEASGALYLGFATALPDTPVSFWLALEQLRSSRMERESLAAEHVSLTAHHDARTVWEFFADVGPGEWRRLDAALGEIADDTRALTLDGRVRVQLPAVAMKKRALEGDDEERYYLRCRVDAGRHDAVPVVREALVNAVAAEQAVPVAHTFVVGAAATVAGAAPAPGGTTRIRITFDADGSIQTLSFMPDVAELPDVRVLAYQAPGADAGALVLDVVPLGTSDGRPNAAFDFPDGSAHGGTIEVWTLEGDAWRSWELRVDLDGSSRTDRHVSVTPDARAIVFGDGERGRIPPPGSTIVARFRVTLGAAGDVAPSTPWMLADVPANRQLVSDFVAVRDAVAAHARPRGSTRGGADAETVDHAAGRAAEALWAHERLVELAPRDGTLDQLGRDVVRARRAPERATTVLDYERLALDIPGARIARARAWANFDPAHPCLRAPGTVTIVIVPELPSGRPRPTEGLLHAARCYLGRRRIVGTRLVVAGPEYLEIGVAATVRRSGGASPARVQHAVRAALDAFFDPLRGGPAGRGWPFGRDVYRSEILQVIDDVPGVDHVLALELVPAEGEATCGNVCVAPTWLVTPGRHAIEVVA